jgi:hypothetical protein
MFDILPVYSEQIMGERTTSDTSEAPISPGQRSPLSNAIANSPEDPPLPIIVEPSHHHQSVPFANPHYARAESVTPASSSISHALIRSNIEDDSLKIFGADDEELSEISDFDPPINCLSSTNAPIQTIRHNPSLKSPVSIARARGRMILDDDDDLVQQKKLNGIVKKKAFKVEQYSDDDIEDANKLGKAIGSHCGPRNLSPAGSVEIIEGQRDASRTSSNNGARRDVSFPVPDTLLSISDAEAKFAAITGINALKKERFVPRELGSSRRVSRGRVLHHKFDEPPKSAKFDMSVKGVRKGEPSQCFCDLILTTSAFTSATKNGKSRTLVKAPVTTLVSLLSPAASKRKRDSPEPLKDVPDNNSDDCYSFRRVVKRHRRDDIPIKPVEPSNGENSLPLKRSTLWSSKGRKRITSSPTPSLPNVDRDAVSNDGLIPNISPKMPPPQQIHRNQILKKGKKAVAVASAVELKDLAPVMKRTGETGSVACKPTAKPIGTSDHRSNVTHVSPRNGVRGLEMQDAQTATMSTTIIIEDEPLDSNELNQVKCIYRAACMR